MSAGETAAFRADLERAGAEVAKLPAERSADDPGDGPSNDSAGRDGSAVGGGYPYRGRIEIPQLVVRVLSKGNSCILAARQWNLWRSEFDGFVDKLRMINFGDGANGEEYTIFVHSV